MTLVQETNSAETVPTQTSAPALPPSVVERGLRISVIEGALSTVHVAITTSVFLTGFALLLGADTFTLGVIGALPFVGQLFQFVGAYLEEQLGSRRRLVIVSALAARLLWLPALLLLFAPFPGALRMSLFLLILAGSYALGGIVINAWLSWMSDLVPVRQRGRYFGFRNTVAGAVSMAATYGAGLVADFYSARGQEAMAYAILFTLAVLFGVLGALLLRRQPEPPMQRKQRVRAGELFAAPLRNTRFRSFALASAGWAVVTGIAAPFFNAYGLQTLQISFSTLALTGIATSAVSLLTQPYIGRLQDRLGDRLVLVVSLFGVVLLPWGWVISTPTNIIPLWLTSIAAGVFWPGITQGMVNVLMDRSPAEGRGAYLAAYGALSGVGTFISGLLGGALASALASVALPLGPLTLNNFTLLFVLSILGRLAVALLFWRKL
jgi:MFS family permease